jgi:hypothetical protein
MKLTPLNNQPNISHSRFESVSPSMRIDSRGYPHITWLDKKQGHNEVHYSFWDGLQWGVREQSLVHRSEEEIVISKNGIIIDSDQPAIVFAKRKSEGSLLNLFTPFGGSWTENFLVTSYDTKWIGVERTNRGLNFSSSSSSSLEYSSSSSSSSWEYSSSSSSIDSSSSSSSIDSSSSSSSSIGNSSSFSSNSIQYSSIDSSSSSSSSIGNSSSSSSSSIGNSSSSSSIGNSSSSSSSTDSSSSSSIDSNSSSSSSSINDTNIMVSTYDGENVRVYSVSDSQWLLLTTTVMSIDDIETMKMASCGNKLGFAYMESTSIKYNFFDVEINTWSFTEFQTLQASVTNGNIIDFDIAGYNKEEDGILSIGWLNDTTSVFYVNHTNVDSRGIEGVDDSENTEVVNRIKNVQAENYIVYGYQRIAININSNHLPRILGSGAETTLYTKDNYGVWSTLPIDIEGTVTGFVPNQLALQIYEDSGSEYAKVVFGNNQGDIYYFEDIGEDGFEMVYPDLVVLNQERIFITSWGCGKLEGEEVNCTYTNKTGDMLKEALNKTVIVIDDNEDPNCI